MSSSDESKSNFYTAEDEMMIGEAVALDVRPTGFVLRAAGAAIDFIVYFGLWIVILVAVSAPVIVENMSDAMMRAIIVAALVFCIVVIPVTVELVTRGRSLGKLAVGARIVRDDGGAIGFRHAFTRALVGVLEVYMTLGGFAALVALLNPKAKRLGDLIAGTYSQNERTSRYVPPVYGVPLELVEWAKTADVAKMPDRTARRISQFLANAAGFTPQSRVAAALSLAQEAAPYVYPLPNADPELFLAAITTVRRDREFAALQQEKIRLGALAPSLGRMPRDFPVRENPRP
jgi:uncharacterized RDD family membrane protein YckC